jgi:phosphoribosylformylglycinamidine synthase
VGDPTLSAKEIIVTSLKKEWDWLLVRKDIDTLQKIADRERSYVPSR